MKTAFLFLIPLAAILLLAAPIIPMIKKVKSGKSPKNAFIFNLCSFFGLMIIATIIPLGNFASAAAEAGGVVAAVSTGAGLGYIAAALSVGLSCLGGGIAVASGSSAAIGAVSENPNSFVKALIFVVLGEGIALYGLLISIMIISNLG